MEDKNKTNIENSYNFNAIEVLSDGYDSDKDPEFVVTEAENIVSSSEQEGSDHLEKNESNNNDGHEATNFLRPRKGRKRRSLNMTRTQNKKAKNENKTFSVPVLKNAIQH